MRVVLTCDWFLKYAAAQSAGLARAGAEVLLLCRDHAHEFGGDQDERRASLEPARAAGVQVLELPGRYSDPRVAPKLARVALRVRRFGADVVHAHDGADPRALPMLAGIPTVLTIHDPVPHPGQPVPQARKRWLLHGGREGWRARARVIVVHSESLRSQPALRPGQRYAVIAHGLDVAEQPLPPPGEPVVAFFGRLTPYKGLDVLARAMPLVWAQRPETRLYVAGFGDEPFQLDDARVELQRRYLPEADVQRFFARASLAVLPYTEASQTGVGSVAVGFGVPVVASKLAGLPDLALDESYLVKPGDPASLAETIVRHLDDGPEVRRHVMDEVARPRSWTAVGALSLRLYEDLLEGRA